MRLRLALTAVLLLTAGLAQAAVYNLPSKGNDLVGKVTHIQTHHADTFVKIARRYDVGFRELVLANPDVDPWLPGQGTDIVIPTRYILPDVPRQGIVVNLAEMRVYYYPPKSSQYAGKVFTYPIGIGRKGWTTPLGTTTVVAKEPHPNWVPPESIRKEHAAKGDPLPRVVPAGPNNPLGQYAMHLGFPGYLMHGTNHPAGIGLRVSHGCLRMFPEDIAAMFSMVNVGTRVRIINKPYKFGWESDKLYMVAQPPDATGKAPVRSYTPWVKALIKATKKRPKVPINWNQAQAMARNANGIPALIEKTQVAQR